MREIVKFTKIITLIILTMLILTTCFNPFDVGLGEKVDLDAPELEITSHRNGDAVGGTFVLEGSATDDGLVKSVSISNETEDNMVKNASLNGDNWSYNYDSTGLSDGDHEFIITVTDDTDKKVSAKLLLTVDNNPPTILVTSPAEYGTLADNPEFNKSIAIKGEAADTTRVREVLISLLDSSDDTPVFTDKKATGTSSWYYIFDSENIVGGDVPDGTSLSTGNYYFSVKAVDYSDNETTYFYHFQDILKNAVDKSATPNVEEINAVDYQGENQSILGLVGSLEDLRIPSPLGKMEIKINPNSDQPQFTIINPAEESTMPSENVFSNPQRLSGFVEDDDLAGINEATLELTIKDWATDTVVESLLYDGATTPDFTLSGNTWTYESTLDDGEYGVVLTVDDAGDVTGTSNYVPFSVNASVPSIVITSPSPGTYVGDGKSVTIAVEVNNSDGSDWPGSEVYLDPDGDGSWTDGSALLMNDLGNGNFSLNITEGSDFNFSTDGSYNFRIRAGSGSVTGNAVLSVTADITEPSMVIATPGDGEQVNGTIKLRGTADDTAAVAAVYYKLEAGDISEYPSYPEDPAANGWTEITSSVYNWSTDLDTAALNPQGIYTLHYFVKDAAGNLGSDGVLTHPAKINFTADQSTDIPVITISQPEDGGRMGIDSSIIGTVEDDDLVDVSTIMVSLDEGNDGSFTAPEPVSNFPASDSSVASWSHSLVGVPEGQHAFKITVDDIKTNGEPVNSAELTYTFIVDGGPPALEITGPDANSLWNSDVSVSGTTADANGVQSMAFSADGSTWEPITITPTNDGTQINWNYTFTVDGTNDGQYNIQVRSVDQAGATTTKYLPFEVDTTPPILKITEPPESVTVNGNSITVGGTVNDVNDITGLYYYITPDTATSPTSAGDLTGWISVPIAYSWSFTFNSLEYESSTNAVDYKIWMRAIDHADLLNETDDTLADHSLVFTIDQSTDRPVISFNDIDASSITASDNVLVGATSLTGLVEDDDLIDPSVSVPIEISIDGGAWTAVNLAPLAGDAAKPTMVWKHDIGSLDEGVHHVRVRAIDSESDGTVGDTSTSAQYTDNYNWEIVENADLSTGNPDLDKVEGVPFILNRGAPTISVTEPGNYTYHKENVIISGTSVDANGVELVEISFDNGQNFTTIADFSGSPQSPGPWTTTYPVSDGEGVISYIIRATDAYNSTSIANGQFTVDTTIPTIVVAEPDPADTLNGTVTFNGTGGDSSLSEVYYSILPKWTDSSHVAETTAPALPIIAADGSVSDPGDYSLVTGNYSWSEVFDTTGTAVFTQGDETYIFRALSVDLAGNMSTLSSVEFSVDQETDRPDISFSSVVEGAGFADNLIPQSKQINGSVSDDDSVDGSTMQYRLYDENDTEITSGWTTIDPSGQPSDSTLGTWSHTLTQSDGKYKIQLRVADINDAGAYTNDGYGWYESPLVQLAIDTANPKTDFNSPSADNGGYINDDL